MNIKRLVVTFSIWPKFSRAKVQCDLEKVSFDHVGSSSLQVMLPKGF